MSAAQAKLKVYWQPGCTSCLRAKELLDAHGVEFESINVLESDHALEELRALGARAVPVVARGRDFVFAQDIDELARFVGIALQRERLPLDALIARLARLLEVGASCAAAIPVARLGDEIPRRPRRYADIVWHVGMIVRALLEGARGARLTFELYEATAPTDALSPERLAAWIHSVREELLAWWAGSRESLPATVDTFYGIRPFHEVLERSAWHVAQHCRQLDFIVRHVGAVAADGLRGEDLQGLPVPKGVWDPEIRFA